MSQQSPNPRMSDHEKAERTHFQFSVSLAERDLIAKAACKAGMQAGKYARDLLLKIASGEYVIVEA